MADDPTPEPGPEAEGPQRFFGFDEDISGIVVPDELPILPLRGVVIFPSAIVPLLISRGPSLKLVEDRLAGDRTLGLVSQKNPEEENPEPEGLYARGTAGRILKMLKYPDGSVRMRARYNAALDPRVVVGEHGWWQGCDALGASGFDPFGPDGANYNALIGTAARDPVSGTAAHRSYLCEIRPAR